MAIVQGKNMNVELSFKMDYVIIIISNFIRELEQGNFIGYQFV